MHSPRIAALLVLASLACGDDGPRDPAECGDLRATPKVFFGTDRPTFAPLRPGQLQAIGSFVPGFQRSPFCSGTLIAPRHVLTAAHCEIQPEDRFCIGDTTPSAECIAITAATSAPPIAVDGKAIEFDLTIVELAEDAATAVPGVEPIPIAVTALTGLEKERVETAGYGQTEDDRFGTRLFALERVDAIGPADDENGPSILRVDGLGARGVCVGDSGGPALIVDGESTVRVAGALSYGDPSCVDKDRYARVDLAREWIESFTGPAPTGTAAPCGPITATGICSGDRALHCEGDRLAVRTCDNVCGWDAAAEGFRCLAGDDPCRGQDLVGSCAGDVARWCERGVPKSADCDCLDQECAIHPSVGASCRGVH